MIEQFIEMNPFEDYHGGMCDCFNIEDGVPIEGYFPWFALYVDQLWHAYAGEEHERFVEFIAHVSEHEIIHLVLTDERIPDGESLFDRLMGTSDHERIIARTIDKPRVIGKAYHDARTG